MAEIYSQIDTKTMEMLEQNSQVFLKETLHNPFLLEDYQEAVEVGQVESVDNTAYAIVASILTLDIGYSKNTSKDDLKWYHFLEEQIYLFLKGNAPEYRREFLNAQNVQQLVGSMAAVFVAQATNISLPLATGLVTFLLFTVGKIGIKTWCGYYENKKGIKETKPDE